MTNTAKLNVTMTKEGVGGKTLGKRVSNHVTGGAIDEDHLAGSNTFTQSMDSEVYVLGTFVMNWVFRQESASPVILP